MTGVQTCALPIYQNGILCATYNNVTYNFVSDSSTFYIGNTQQTGIFYGNLSNIRILNGTALYNSNFIPAFGPLPAITNTVLLTCQNDLNVVNYYNSGTPKDNSSTNVQFTGVAIPAGYLYWPSANNVYSPTQISAGGQFTQAITADFMVAWGSNTVGQLGLNQATASFTYPIPSLNNSYNGLYGTQWYASAPVQISSSSWNQVYAGVSTVAAIKGDGTLWGWGANI